jgi:hypothetical protein
MPALRNSRYSLSATLQDADGRLYLADPDPFRYQDLPDNRYYTVAPGDTLFKIAERSFPGTADSAWLWWAICWFQPQPIHDPTIALVPGHMLVIPSERTLKEKILSSARAQR